MEKSHIHGHGYHHDEDLQSVVESLRTQEKYKERLGAAREEALRTGKGKFEAGGHHYRLEYDKGDDRYELKHDHF